MVIAAAFTDEDGNYYEGTVALSKDDLRTQQRVNPHLTVAVTYRDKANKRRLLRVKVNAIKPK